MLVDAYLQIASQNLLFLSTKLVKIYADLLRKVTRCLTIKYPSV